VDSVAIISFRVTTVPDCNQNQTAQSDTQHVLSDFEHNQGRPTVLVVSFYFCIYCKLLYTTTDTFTGIYCQIWDLLYKSCLDGKFLNLYGDSI
jgi:hypothetical protein